MNKIEHIADYYGLQHQLNKLREELGELDTAALCVEMDMILRNEFIPPETIDALVDELADVSVMLQQIMHLTNTHDAVRERIQFKVNRQLERIAVEANNEQPDN